MKILFELGDGQNAYLGLMMYEKNLGPFFNYRYSKIYQAHELGVWRLKLVWRVRPYQWSKR